jgi:hypothetical protein
MATFVGIGSGEGTGPARLESLGRRIVGGVVAALEEKAALQQQVSRFRLLGEMRLVVVALGNSCWMPLYVANASVAAGAAAVFCPAERHIKRTLTCKELYQFQGQTTYCSYRCPSGVRPYTVYGNVENLHENQTWR